MPSSQETYLRLTLDEKITLKITHDFDKGKGTYTELTTTKQIGKAQLTTKIGHNTHYFREKSGMSDLEIKIERQIKTRKATITPMIGHTKALDNDFKNETTGGISIQVKF